METVTTKCEACFAVRGLVPSLGVAAFGPPITKFRALVAKLEVSVHGEVSGNFRITRVLELEEAYGGYNVVDLENYDY